MRKLRFIPDVTNFDFVSHRRIAFGVSGLLLLIAVIAFPVRGLNLGIDFKGGILMEIRAAQSVNMGAVRDKLTHLGLGEVELQALGDANTLLVRVQRQEGGEKAQDAAVQKVRGALGTDYEYRRVELVGPKVGEELFRAGIIASVLAVLAIAVYVWFRFEWQFAVGALVATGHDVVTAAGLFSVFQIEFNLTAVAALLTLAGYSVNDTVVVYDRIREMLRKHKKATLPWIINTSVNATLSRTTLTSITTLLAMIPLLAFGGEALFNFSVAMIFGIIVGTYSSIFVAACLLLYLPAVGRRIIGEDEEAAARGGAADAAP